MKLLKISSLYKKKKRDDNDTPKNDPNMSNLNTSLSEDNNTVGLNNLRKNRTESNNDIFSDCDQNNVNARSFENTNEKNKLSLKNIKSYSTRQHSSSVLDSDISDSDDAKQESNKLHSSNNRKNTQPITNNTKRPLQYQHRQRRKDGSSYKMNPDTETVISTSSNKVSMNDPVIARMQDRHRNQVKMAALRKQQMLLEDEEREKRLSPGSVYSPPPKSPSVSSAFSGNHYYPHQQSPLPPMVPYMVLSPYATPMMDPYMYHSQVRPLQTSLSSYPSYVSLPASLHHNQYSLYNEQQQEEDNTPEFDCTTNARTRSTSVLPSLTKTNIYEKGISSSQSSSDTELSTPSKESLAKEFTTLDEGNGEEDAAEADVESNNEDGSAEVDKLRQKDNHHHGTSGYTRTRNTKNEEKAFNEYFNHCDKMQAYQQQWYGQQQQQQQQQYPIYSPYYFHSTPPSFYAGMDPYYAQQDRRTSLMSNGPISQG